MKTVIVAGALANKYLNGGAVWTRLSWALGFKKLGFEVFFLEQIDAASCVDASGKRCAFDQSANLSWFRRITEAFGLGDSAALIQTGGERHHGLSHQELRDLSADADLLINITGHLKGDSLLPGRALKIYIDLDPGYTQFWHAAGLLDESFARHDHYFTIGEAIGAPGCSVPSGGVVWRATRQPVVLEHWPVSPAPDPERFTTVASWRDPNGTVSHQGRTFGLKVHEFRKFIELPERIQQRCEIALDIHPADQADRERLLAHGWMLSDPKAVAADPDGFRAYVQSSGGEFSVAKGAYVLTRCGWFSDRSVRYLASGRPVLVQDTGCKIASGKGLLTFGTLEEAVVGARRIAADYPAHCRAARALAETYFDSDRVLGRLLEDAGMAP